MTGNIWGTLGKQPWIRPRLVIAIMGVGAVAAASSLITARIIGEPGAARRSAMTETQPQATTPVRAASGAAMTTRASAPGVDPGAPAPATSAKTRPHDGEPPSRAAALQRTVHPRAGHGASKPAGGRQAAGPALRPAEPPPGPDLEQALADAHGRELRLQEQAAQERERRMAAEDDARTAESRLARERALRDRDWARAGRSRDFAACLSYCHACHDFVVRYGWGEDVDHARRLDRTCRLNGDRLTWGRQPPHRDGERPGAWPGGPPAHPPARDVAPHPVTPGEPPGGRVQPERPRRPLPGWPADVTPPQSPDPAPPVWQDPGQTGPDRPALPPTFDPTPGVRPFNPLPERPQPVTPPSTPPETAPPEPAAPAVVREGPRDPPGDAREP